MILVARLVILFAAIEGCGFFCHSCDGVFHTEWADGAKTN